MVLFHWNVSARAHGLSVGGVGNVVKLPSVSRVFLFFVGNIHIPEACMPLLFLENHPARSEEVRK